MHSNMHKALAALDEKPSAGAKLIRAIATDSKVFVVDGSLLDDNALVTFGLELIDKKLLRLPFKKTTIEIINPPYIPAQRAFIFCMEDCGAAFSRDKTVVQRGESDCQIAVSYFAYTTEGRRKISPGTFFIDTANPQDFEYSFLVQTLDIENPAKNSDIHEMIEYLVYIIGAFVSLINSKSTKVTERLEPEKLNRSRKRAGKTPLPAFRVVDVPAAFRSSKATQNIGVGRSPRMHWRRGHLRRWGDNFIPVSPCIVNASEEGVVEQIYRARRNVNAEGAAATALTSGVEAVRS